jgi:hypothetical protein
MDILVKKETDTALDKCIDDVFGNDWEHFEIAHLAFLTE